MPNAAFSAASLIKTALERIAFERARKSAKCHHIPEVMTKNNEMASSLRPAPLTRHTLPLKNTPSVLLLAMLSALSVLSTGAAAAVHERPVVDKQYDDYLIYDADGSGDVSWQDTENGVRQNYYFNAGALIDGSGNTPAATILSHNWGGGYNDQTAKIIWVGAGKDLTVKQYSSCSAIEAEDGAQIEIHGGNIRVENGGIGLTHENTSSALYAEDGGRIAIDAESLHIDNKRVGETNVYNRGAICANDIGAVVDIDLSGDFSAINVAMGVVIQDRSGKTTSATVNAGGDIRVVTEYPLELSSNQNVIPHYTGSGIYSLAKNNTTDRAIVSLVSEHGNVTLDTRKFGIYGYGNITTTLQAAEGAVTVSARDTHGIFAKTDFERANCVTDLSGRSVTVSSLKGYGIRATNATVNLTAAEKLAVSSVESYGIHATDTIVNLASEGNLAVSSARHYGIYATNSTVNLASADKLTVSSEKWSSLRLYQDAQATVTAADARFEGDVFNNDSDLKVLSNSTVVAGGLQLLNGATAEFASTAGTAEGRTLITSDDATAVAAYSPTDAAVTVHLAQDTEIVAPAAAGAAQRDAAGKIRHEFAAIRAGHASTVTADRLKAVTGDIMALQGSGLAANAPAGVVKATTARGGRVTGDLLAANGGGIDLTVAGAGSVLEGAADDFHDTGAAGDAFTHEHLLCEEARIVEDGYYKYIVRDVAVDRGGEIALTLDAGSWNLTGSSMISDLRFGQGGGTVNLVRTGGDFLTLRSGALSGDGSLNMHMDMTADKTDTLVVENAATGNLRLALDLSGSTDADYTTRLISQGEGSSLTVTNANGENRFIAPGAVTVWKLGFVGKDQADALTTDEGRAGLVNTGSGSGDWHLIRTNDTVTPEIRDNVTIGTSAAQALAYMADLEDLRTRLGEVRAGAQDGIWVRAAARSEEVRAAHGRGFSQDVRGINFGVDRLIGTSEESAWLVGAAFRTSRADQEGIGIGGTKGRLDEYSLKGYATWMHAGGSYADLVVQAGRYLQDLEGMDNAGDGHVRSDWGTWGFGASVEAGHLFSFGEGADDRRWFGNAFVEPQFELSYFHARGADYRTTTGMEVDQDNADFLTGRAGIVVGRKFSGSPDELTRRYFQIAAIGGVKHEFLGGDQTTRYTGVDGGRASVKADDVARDRFYWGLNADWQAGENLRLYAQVSQERGDGYEKDYDVSVGARWRF